MALKARNDIHLARRLWHFSGVMAIFILYLVVPEAQRRPVALVMCLTPICLDLARLYSPVLNSILMKFFRPFMRQGEADHIAALSYMLAGVLVLILAFPPTVTCLSLLFLAVGDPLASYFGIRFGKDKLIGNKSVQGSMAAFIACFMLSLIYFSIRHLMIERLFIVCLLSGLIGAFSELLPVGKLDDNFVFPVVSASLLTGLLTLFGGL